MIGKNRFLRWLAMAAFVVTVSNSAAMAQNRLFAVNAFSNDASSPLASYGLWELDINTGVQISGTVITLPGFTVTGANSITVDPTSGLVYVILKVSGVSGRVLATIDLNTGVATSIGNLGDNFSSLAFRADGQLFGTTGDGATVPETLYTIDKTTAAKTLARPLGNGADGEVIAFNPIDQNFYHWSGNGTIVMEKFTSTPPYTITPIFTGSVDGEIFGAAWDPCHGDFLVTDISSFMHRVTTDGVFSAPLGTGVEDQRGLAMIPPYTCRTHTAPTMNLKAMLLLLCTLGIVGAYRLRRARGAVNRASKMGLGA